MATTFIVTVWQRGHRKGFTSKTFRSSRVVVQSPAAHPRNGDAARIRRLLAHELTHLLVAEISGSTWCLGDGGDHRRLPTWLDEGLAEVCSLTVTGRVGQLAAMGRRAAEDDAHLSLRELDRRLDDLTHPARTQAFERATAAVLARVTPDGLPRLFHDLDRAAAAGPA